MTACACAITALLGYAFSCCFSSLYLKNILGSCKVEVLFFKYGFEVFIGPLSKGKPALFAQQDGCLTNSFLPKGEAGVGCTLCQIRFWFCIFISEHVCFTISGTWHYIFYDFSMKSIRKCWMSFLLLNILAKNSSQLSYTELPFTVARPKISFKLCFIIESIKVG